jgi:hypothetical protein
MKLGSKQDCDEAHFRSFFKKVTVRDKKRLDFARQLPCAGCGSPAPNDVHHEGEHGMGIKASDYDSLPLCRKCHAWRHQSGPSVFELWRVDVEKLLERINQVYALTKLQ